MIPGSTAVHSYLMLTDDRFLFPVGVEFSLGIVFGPSEGSPQSKLDHVKSNSFDNLL